MDLRVLLVTGDQGGCAFYRMELPAAMAAQANLPVEVSSGLPGKEGKNGPEVDYDYAREHYDVIVIQRPLLQVIHDAIDGLQKAGITVIIEVDDDFTSVHKRNQAYIRTDPNNPGTPYNRDLVLSACRKADHVIVTTPQLVTVYGGSGRVSIIPNFIPGFLLAWKFVKHRRVLGWSGAISTHPADLQVVGHSVALALTETRAQFIVVGHAQGVRRALRLQHEPQETGWLPVADYWRELGRLNAGIVPLENSNFNRAKSNLKGLEYAATGVPFVASPLPEYSTLYKKGAGMIASRPREWLRALTQLLSDDKLRKEEEDSGRFAVHQHYMLERNWHLWPEAWERAWRLGHK